MRESYADLVDPWALVRLGGLFLLGVVCGCGPAMRPARLADAEPASERELGSERRVAGAECGPALGLAFPGLGQLCHGKTAEGVTLATLGAAELGTASASPCIGTTVSTASSIRPRPSR
jgi:hypothetical protein